MNTPFGKGVLTCLALALAVPARAPAADQPAPRPHILFLLADGLPLEERTLPQALREAGYETAVCGKWHLGHFRHEYLPTRRGFEHQYGHYNGAIDYFTHERDGGLDWHRDDRALREEGYSTALV